MSDVFFDKDGSLYIRAITFVPPMLGEVPQLRPLAVVVPKRILPLRFAVGKVVPSLNEQIMLPIQVVSDQRGYRAERALLLVPMMIARCVAAFAPVFISA